MRRRGVASVSPQIHCLFEAQAAGRRSRRGAGEAVAATAFSVVICTDGRLDHLRQTISALHQQTHGNFEVCVVAGPTDDGTRAYLADLDGQVKVARCSARNLSRSRNIGIALSSGDVVAFIDDDAIPEPEWLAQLARSYDDANVGAAGGVVHDHRGIDYQARFVTVDRLGLPRNEPRPTPELNVPGSARFPHLLGTNCSFRRAVLLEVGGFDEQYEYFLDETDLCCRVNDAGHHIVQRPDAFVHHKYAPSEVRDAERTVRSWYPLIKNRLYFGLRHARASVPVEEIVEAGLAERDFWQKDVSDKVRAGIFGPDEMRRFQREARSAIEDGLKFGESEPGLLDRDVLSTHSSQFRPFSGAARSRKSRVLLYLDTGPEERSSNEIAAHARRMAKKGHQVHLVTRRADMAYVDFEEGLWTYDLGTEHSADSDRDDAALFATVERIALRRQVDAVYCADDDADSFRVWGKKVVSRPGVPDD